MSNYEPGNYRVTFNDSTSRPPKRTIITIIIITILLALLNPTMNNFCEYAVEQSYGSEIDSSDSLWAMAEYTMIEKFYNRDNYIIFSIYSSPFDDAKYLGVAKQIIKLAY